LQNKPTPTRLGNYSVVRSAIEPRAVGNDQIAANAITNDQIQADAIKQAQLDSDSVGRNEIINGEVVESKLATDAVTRDKVLNGEIVDGKLGDASVNLINMKPNSVANTQLTTDSVNFRTVATNAIGNENMLGDSVGNDELQNDSVGSGELRNDSVGFGELQSSSVGNSTLQTGSVTSSKIGSGQVSSTQIANGAVTADKIGNNQVTSTKISEPTRRIIVSGGLTTGSGITKNANNIDVNFGGGSTQVARGNHTHSYSFNFYARDSANRGLTSLLTLSRTTSAPSTRRVKKNIETHTPSNIKNLLDLEPKKYKYKRSERASHESLNKEWMHGYIAEELIDLGFPEPVGYDAEGRPASLDYGLMSMLVLELVKVQQDEINLLREEVLILKDKK
jgi:hypothetical protein